MNEENVRRRFIIMSFVLEYIVHERFIHNDFYNNISECVLTVNFVSLTGMNSCICVILY